jgi:hypothetical protein
MVMMKKNKECFFDPTQPLTSTIFKSLNYEFMCCILSGLKQIFDNMADKSDKTLNPSKSGIIDITRIKVNVKGEPEK